MTVTVRRYGIRAMAVLTARAPDDGGFEVIALGLAPPAPAPGTATPQEYTAEMRVMWLAGGVTASWLEHQVADWFNDQRQMKRKARKGPAVVRPKTSRSIH